MDTLANVVDHAGTIILLLEPNNRFSQSLQTMLKRMTIIFGQDWWSYVVIGVSKWPYDQDSIDDREERCEDRPDKCQDEAWFCREFNAQLREKLRTKTSSVFSPTRGLKQKTTSETQFSRSTGLRRQEFFGTSQSPERRTSAS